jgi:hypothetical protein
MWNTQNSDFLNPTCSDHSDLALTGYGPRAPWAQSPIFYFISSARTPIDGPRSSTSRLDNLQYSNPPKNPKKIERSTPIQRVVTYYLFTFQPLEPQIDLTHPGNAAGTPGGWMGTRSPVHAVSWPNPRAPGSHQSNMEVEHYIIYRLFSLIFLQKRVKNVFLPPFREGDYIIYICIFLTGAGADDTIC